MLVRIGMLIPLEVQNRIAVGVLGTPRPLLHLLLRRRRRRYRGAALDPTVQLMLGLLRISGRRPVHEQEPPRARASLAALSAPFEVEHVECRTEEAVLGGVPVRVYRGGADDAPAMMYYHGGGFVVGSVDSYDRVCRYVARRAEATVVSVEYRLAPEHRYPAAHEDAKTAYDAAIGGGLEGLRASRWMVAGDSAGGNLAAVVAHHAKDTGTPLSFQYLVYPATDLARDTVSCRDLCDGGYVLTRELIDWFGTHLTVDPAVRRHPAASPLRRDDLEGLCPAKIVTAGFDPLWDEGEHYAEKLRAANVGVEHVHYATMIHGFLNVAGVVPEGRRLLDDMARTLRSL